MLTTGMEKKVINGQAVAKESWEHHFRHAPNVYLFDVRDAFFPPGINVAERSYRAHVFFICSAGKECDTGGDSSICAEWMMAISGAPSVLISVCGCQWSCGCARSPRARLLISVWTAIALSALRLFRQIIPAFPFLSIKGTVIYSFNFPTRAILRIDLSP